MDPSHYVQRLTTTYLSSAGVEFLVYNRPTDSAEGFSLNRPFLDKVDILLVDDVTSTMIDIHSLQLERKKVVTVSEKVPRIPNGEYVLVSQLSKLASIY